MMMLCAIEVGTELISSQEISYKAEYAVHKHKDKTYSMLPIIQTPIIWKY